MDALERLLLISEMSTLVEIRDAVRELEDRLKAVEVQVSKGHSESDDPVEGDVERMTAEATAREGPGEERSVCDEKRAGERESKDMLAGVFQQLRSVVYSRQFRSTSPSVVTMEPQPGDEQIYGTAWPLVDEWRRLRQSHPAPGRGVSWLVDEERMREMEIALIDKHELTMPPDTDAWDSLGRGTQVRWRIQTVERVRGERVRAQFRRWVRRLLTLGLWRK